MDINILHKFIHNCKQYDYLNFGKPIVKFNNYTFDEIMVKNIEMKINVKEPYTLFGVEIEIDNSIPTGKFIYTYKESNRYE